jgi:hypothetical protein
MDELAQYQEVRSTLRLTLRLLRLGENWYVLALTARRPNPAYNHIYWRDTESTVSSHVEATKLVGNEPTELLARREYRRIVGLLRFMGSEIPDLQPEPTPEPTNEQLAELRASIKADRAAVKLAAKNKPVAASSFVPYSGKKG